MESGNIVLLGLTAPLGSDRFSKVDDYGTRAGIVVQVLLTTEMAKKEDATESWHCLGASRTK